MTRFFILLSCLVGIGVTLAGWHFDGGGFDPRLAGHWLWLKDEIYSNGKAPAGYMDWVWIGLGIAFGLAIASALVGGKASSSTKHGGHDKKSLHGSARFARPSEIKKAKLFRKEGIVIGGVKAAFGRIKPLVYAGGEHVIAFCPTGTGKGVSLVINTLFFWRHSTLVLDIKGENFALSSGFRKMLGQKVLKFKPTSQQPFNRWNALAEVRMYSDYEIMDVQTIAGMIMNPTGEAKSSGKDDFFKDTGTEWLTVCILHCLHVIERGEGRCANLRDVSLMMGGSMLLDAIDDADDPDLNVIEEICNEMLRFDHHYPIVDQEIRRVARQFRKEPDNQRGGTHKTATTKLAIYADPIIARNTAVSDFKIDDLMNSETPANLYLHMEPGELQRVRPVMRLFLNMMFARTLPDLEYAHGRSLVAAKHKMLLLWDEFTALGKLEIVEQSIAYWRGYGIQAMIIIQDLPQLQKHYGKENAIFGNCKVRVAFTPNDIQTAKTLSEMLGKTTVVQAKTSVSRKTGESHGSRSVSLNETARPLMTADEIMAMPTLESDPDTGKLRQIGENLTFVSGLRPVHGLQWLYFRNKQMLRNAQIPPVWDAPANEDSQPKQDHPDANDDMTNPPHIRMAKAAGRAEKRDRFRDTLAANTGQDD